MAIQAALEMLKGRTVWSNMDISFVWEGNKIYRSLPLDMEALYTFDVGISDGVVCIDEINLWADSANWMSIGSKLIASIFQLLRKRSLSFYLTVQNFQWLNNRLRWQTDLLVRCYDLCYRYHNLEPGDIVSQSRVDLSGILTGKVYNPAMPKESTSERLLRTRRFKGIYNTLLEFDYLDIQSNKYKIDSTTKVIRDGVITEKPTLEAAKNNVRFMLDSLRAEGKQMITVDDMKSIVRDYGIEQGFTTVGRILSKEGVTFRRSRKGDYYLLSDESDTGLE